MVRCVSEFSEGHFFIVFHLANEKHSYNKLPALGEVLYLHRFLA